MGYWCKVARRAFRETRDAIRLDTFVRVITNVVAPLTSGAIMWWVTGSPLQGGAVTVGFVLLIGACVFAWKMLSLPPVMAAEADAFAKETRSQMEAGEQRQSKLLALSQYLEEGEGVRARFASGPGPDTVAQDHARWTEAVSSYLESKFDMATAIQFRAATGNAFMGTPAGKPVAGGAFWQDLGGKCAFINRLIDDVRRTDPRP